MVQNDLALIFSYQGHWKQSPDGQAQLDVSGEVANNLRSSAHGKNLDLGIFSNEEALSLHFSFKLGFLVLEV